MTKKFNGPQNKQRQRQKISRKTIVIISAFTMACIVIGFTLFFHMSHVNPSSAATPNLIIVEEQTFTTEKTVDAPLLKSQPQAAPNTLFAKKIKGQ
jgi:hypothetical protein